MGLVPRCPELCCSLLKASESLPVLRTSRLHFSDHVLGMILQAIELLVTAGLAPQGPPCAPQQPRAAVAAPNLCQGLACFLVTLHLFDQEGGNRVYSPVFIGIVCSFLHLLGEENI